MKILATVAVAAFSLLVSACKHEPVAAPAKPATPPVSAPEAPKAAAPKASPEGVPAKPAAQPAAEPTPTKIAPALPVTAKIADLPQVLSGIKDAATAEASKGALDSIVQQLQTAKASAGADAANAAKNALGKLAGSAATKLGVSADTVKTVEVLLADPAIKGAIGPVLEKLQGLLK